MQKGSQQMDVVSSITLCCIFKSDTGLKTSSLFSVKGLDMNIFLFYTHFKMWEKETEKYLMMKSLKHNIQIYWQEAVLISFLPVFYMPPLASLFVYLIQYFHPLYTASPNLFLYSSCTHFSLSTMYFHVFLLFYVFSISSHVSLIPVLEASYKHLYS